MPYSRGGDDNAAAGAEPALQRAIVVRVSVFRQQRRPGDRRILPVIRVEVAIRGARRRCSSRLLGAARPFHGLSLRERHPRQGGSGEHGESGPSRKRNFVAKLSSSLRSGSIDRPRTALQCQRKQALRGGFVSRPGPLAAFGRDRRCHPARRCLLLRRPDQHAFGLIGAGCGQSAYRAGDSQRADQSLADAEDWHGQSRSVRVGHPRGE